jgi:hypothetical protein
MCDDCQKDSESQRAAASQYENDVENLNSHWKKFVTTKYDEKGKEHHKKGCFNEPFNPRFGRLKGFWINGDGIIAIVSLVSLSGIRLKCLLG